MKLSTFVPLIFALSAVQAAPVANAEAKPVPGFSWHSWTRNGGIYKRDDNSIVAPDGAKVAVFYSSTDDIDSGAEPIAIYTLE